MRRFLGAARRPSWLVLGLVAIGLIVSSVGCQTHCDSTCDCRQSRPGSPGQPGARINKNIKSFGADTSMWGDDNGDGRKSLCR